MRDRNCSGTATFIPHLPVHDERRRMTLQGHHHGLPQSPPLPLMDVEDRVFVSGERCGGREGAKDTYLKDNFSTLALNRVFEPSVDCV